MLLVKQTFTVKFLKCGLLDKNDLVYSIATNRLAVNSNDIAGLVLKLEYELGFLKIEDLTNTMQKVLSVGRTINVTNFTKIFPLLQGDITVLQEVIPNYPMVFWVTRIDVVNNYEYFLS